MSIFSLLVDLLRFALLKVIAVGGFTLMMWAPSSAAMCAA
jgi:hypothetical protein